ncbi:MAG: hypothetical protein Q8K18_03925, partial [Burkholderiales bacterium]|nr:hypothetical protein [Burkholderiales bacterium]
MAKIVDNNALVAAHIANMGKTSNDGSGDFGRNPKGRDAEQRFAVARPIMGENKARGRVAPARGSWRCRTIAYFP